MFGSDPSFDASPAVQGAPITGNGALGMSPNFWNNLAMFGAALSAGANQRTPSGHLANGTGFGGALGAGTLDYMQLQRQNALSRAQMGVQQQQARQLGLANDITQMSLPIIQEGNRQALDYMRGVPLPDTQNTTPYGSGDETPVQHSIGQVESGGNPKAVNAQGYAGQYQLGTAALAAAGVYKPAEGEDLSKNEWKGTINLPGFQPMTMQQFAQNPQAQKLAWQAHQANLDKEIQTRGLDSYVGQTVGGVPITHDSLTAMMQIGGPTGTERFLKSGGLYDPADANGTRISDYALKVTGGQPQQASARGVQYAGPGVPQPGLAQGQPTPLVPPQASGGAPAQAPAQPPAAQSSPSNGQPQPPIPGPDPQLLAQANQYRQMAIAYGRVPALQGMANQYSQMANQFFKMAYAGQQAAVTKAAEMPFTTTSLRPGGILFQGTTPVGAAPVQSDEVITEGPNRGMRVTVLRDPRTNQIIGGNPTGAINATPGMPPGAIPRELSPLAQGNLKSAGDVQGEDIKHDREEVEGDLSHVLETTIPAKQQLFQLRGLINQANPGAAGQLRADFKNWVQTFAPDFVKDITGDASPAQEFNKIALMGAGKQERGDLGARGGFRAIEMYVKANPNLDMQPTANHDMANALLISHQLHEDYATGATNYYQQNRSQFVKNGEGYNPVSTYDQQFIKVFRPELYVSAINAINGKPYAEWSKGLSNKQIQIVGGILQRTDPNAVIDLGGHRVPVSAFKTVVGPTDIMGGNGG